MITTKDLQSLGELMNFENWMAVKLFYYSELKSGATKTEFKKMAEIHATHHKNLLDYLSSNAK